MAYIAELQIVVDSSQIDAAKKSLDDLSKTSVKVRKETENASQGPSQSALSKREAERKLLAAEAVELEKIISLERERSVISNNFIGDRKRGEPAAALEVTKQKLEAISAGEMKVASATALSSAEYRKQTAEIGKLLGRIDPATKALDGLEQQQLELRRAFQRGFIDDAQFNKFNSQIVGSQQRLVDLSKTTGKTAKEINFSLRGLPAQFTDIAVSLQAGQNPLTVFLQQGGQLKDMFGGIGPAIKAMGGYILGLLTPLNLMIAGLTAVGVLTYKAFTDLSKFNSAIYSSSGLVQQSASELKKASDNAGDLSGNVSKATSAVIELTRQGGLSTDQLVNFSSAISSISDFTGKDITDIATEFKTVGKSASEAALNISEKFGLLRTETLLAVEAAEKNGDAQRALDILSEGLNNAALVRNEEYINSLNGIERKWFDLKRAVSGYYQATKQGLSSTLFPTVEEQISRVEERIALFQSRPESDNNSKTIASLNRTLAALKATQQQEKSADDARAKADQDRITREGIIRNLRKEEEGSLTNVQRLQKQLNKLIDDRTKIFDYYSDGTFSKDEISRADAAIASKRKEIKDAEDKLAKANTKTVTESAASKLLSQMKQQQEALEAQVGSTSKLGKEATSLVKLREQLRLIEEKAGREALTKDQQSLLSNKQTLLLQQEKNVSLEKQITLDKELAKLASYKASLDAQIANDRQKYEDALIGTTSSDKEAARMKERNALMRDYQKQLDELGKQQREGSLDGTYEDAVNALKSNLSERLALQQDHYGKLDQLQASWKNGAIKSWENYLASAKDVSGMTENLFTNAFGSIEDALASFVTTGKLNFKSLTVSILSDLAKMATRIAASQILSSIVGSFAGSYGGGGGTMTGFSEGSFVAQAKGGAWSGGTQFFAKGGAFTNSVVNRPTAFGTGRGLGVMGEAGPEAILPLTRTANGQLGVQAMGGGGGTQVVAPVSVTVHTSSGPGGSSDGGSDSQGRAIQQAVKSECEKAIANGLQPGGMIWRSMNGR